MPSTFLDLTNKLLRRLNEVTIEQSDFPSVRGVQAMAKDAINASVEEINSSEFEWPFNAATDTVVLTPGTVDYTFPNTLKLVDWDSFQLPYDSVLNVSGTPLRYISRDQYLRYIKERDDRAGVAGVGKPDFVFEKHGFGFGVSPSPDEAYTLTYEYYLHPVTMNNYSDISTIPTSYDETVIQGGLYHFYMFRDNSEQADRAQTKFNNMVNRMRTILINKDDRIISTMIIHNRPGGGVISNDYFRW